MTTGPLKRSSSLKNEPLPDELKAEKARPFLCRQCQKTFVSAGHLKRHGLTHSGAKNYSCPFPGCPARCARQDNLQQQ
ncbi:hypothetical protein C8R45DRAFT_837665 [Mycena sanguinolenta]|nr:hypothetical protein C8R45DRAFT_837665 [Mycena sanguinolenta]